jgi:hypothetical protein
MEDDLTQKMEDDLKKMEDDLKRMKMEDDLNFILEKLEWRPQKNGRQPQKKWNGRRPRKIKWKKNQSTKINLIGCLNSPSS